MEDVLRNGYKKELNTYISVAVGNIIFLGPVKMSSRPSRLIKVGDEELRVTRILLIFFELNDVHLLVFIALLFSMK